MPLDRIFLENLGNESTTHLVTCRSGGSIHCSLPSPALPDLERGRWCDAKSHEEFAEFRVASFLAGAGRQAELLCEACLFQGPITRSLIERVARPNHGKEPSIRAIHQTLFDESR